MKISLIGNCQMKALTWFIQQLNEDFDVRYIWTPIGMGRFALGQTLRKRSTPTIVDATAAQNYISASDYIIYQPIRPDRIKRYNHEDIQSYGTTSKLISVGCFYYKRSRGKGTNTEKYEQDTGIVGMKERADKFNLDIQPHKIIEKHGAGRLSTRMALHPSCLYFLELTREICTITGWDYYNDDQYDQYLKKQWPYG